MCSSDLGDGAANLIYFTQLAAQDQETKQGSFKKLRQIKSWWIVLSLLVILWIAGLYSEKRILIQNHQKRIQALEDTVLETQLKYQVVLQENTALQSQVQVRVYGEVGGDIALTAPIREVFTEAVASYREAQYDTAIQGFLAVCADNTNQNLVAESIYFIAASYRQLANEALAYQYYTQYIAAYPTSNYYDDSLYECGHMLDGIGEVAKAKELLTLLQETVPKSMFNNSKTQAVLAKE